MSKLQAVPGSMFQVPCFLLFVFLLASTACALNAQPISTPTEFKYQPFNVQHYDVRATIEDPSSKSISGICYVSMQWKEALNTPSFPVHLRNLKIDRAYLGTEQLVVDSMGLPSSDTFHHRINLGRAVAQQEVDTIVIYYSGVMTNEGGANAWGGVHYLDSVLFAMGVGFANSYVSATEHWMPCYDHPSDKATLHLELTVPLQYVVASNGVFEGASVSSDFKYLTYKWTEDHQIATYLMTMVVGKFKTLNLTEDERIPIVVYTLARDTTASKISYKLVPRMVSLFEELYGLYPFDKVGYVNTQLGAMEHQTMVCMPVSLVQRRDTVNSTAAHELAHQWFGDCVTPQDYRHAWLTESFATYSELVWVESLLGWNTYLQSALNNSNSYIKTSSKNEGVFALYDFPRNAPSSNYPVTIYQKGSVVLAMARALSNDQVFYLALRSFLYGHLLGNATTEDCKMAMEMALGNMTDAFFNEWVYGKGWPQLNIEVAPYGGAYQVYITQEQQTAHPDWPMFTTLPLNLVYRDVQSGELVDTVIVMRGQTLAIPMKTPNEFSINKGTKCRSLIEILRTTSVEQESKRVKGQESKRAGEVIVHPNPANTALHVDLTEYSLGANISVADETGSIVYSSTISAGQTSTVIETSAFANATYYLVVKTTNQTQTIPFVVSH